MKTKTILISGIIVTLIAVSAFYIYKKNKKKIDNKTIQDNFYNSNTSLLDVKVNPINVETTNSNTSSTELALIQSGISPFPVNDTQPIYIAPINIDPVLNPKSPNFSNPNKLITLQHVGDF